MFLTTTHYDSKYCLDRRLFTTQKEADAYARDAVKERIHRIDNLTFMGKVSINMWDITRPARSDHIDEPVATYRD
tara:strand:+ start:64 stop:288 length:225 start_codon:yes stop_codon:yes gene_type:complete